MGIILGTGILIGVVEVVAPRTAIRIRVRTTANDTGHKAQVRDWFDSTFGVAPDNPNAPRNVRRIGVAVIIACLFWTWVWFVAGLGDFL